ncbi:transposase, Ptta/En/Spm [Artemisia annua]|uniref:Transposase, Ptta/En/Spm n=1 Tax=Artemisia annua TaxID=35608 RepID=A0A2U1Q2C8_ARTAN|nr:transposase, Ptta/En/Spm [Artemisia annua]
MTGNKRMQEHGTHNNMNDYERSKRLRVQENQERLRQLGVKNIAKSFTIANDKSVDYYPNPCGDGEEDGNEVATPVKLRQKQHRPRYIAPMAMNKYANLTKKRVSAPHVPRVLPARDACLQNEKSLDPNASKNNQSSAKISMAQLILSKKGALRKKGDFNCNSMEMNSATKNISNGPRRSLFDMRSEGTIARSASHAPLTYKSWPKVPNKEMMWKYVQEKYIVPEDAKSWVLMTIGACWRGYKCRIKKKHFYKFKDMQTRWKNRPKSIPQNDFSQLLTLWSKKDVMKRCLAARNLRLSQKNMHTAGPKSFARIREEMIEEDPNKEEPSLTGMFERTRQRKEGNVYADTYDDTANKIEKMRSYNPPEDESAPADAFLAVMNKEGVTNTLIKKVNGSGIASTVPREIVKSPTVSLEVEKGGQSAHMQKELEANYERRISELKEDHARQLEAIQKQNEDDREKLVEDAVRKILGKISPEVIRGLHRFWCSKASRFTLGLDEKVMLKIYEDEDLYPLVQKLFKFQYALYARYFYVRKNL